MSQKTFHLACVTLLLSITLPSAVAEEPQTAPWSTRMADSIIYRHPKAGTIEPQKADRPPPWSYSTSLAVYAIAQVGLRTGNPKYLQYSRDYADDFLDSTGHIDPTRYKPQTYKLDDIAPGRLLLLLFHATHDDKYRNAALELTAQLKDQPRNSDGGFWHKKIYPHQMWLDGIFMACPFLADAGATLHRPELFDEAATQIQLIASHTRDPNTGLFFHGWDESHAEKWANPSTGTSPNLWGRADGWFAAGIVETLDNLPPDHPARPKLIALLHDFARAIANAQDPSTHLWWQVLDQPRRAGNYPESSASCLFVFALAKAVRLGCLDKHYLDVARTGYDGILKQFVETDPATGTITLKDTCLVAGLGGSPYRDGSYQYYISEPRGSNDPKAMGPFILASLELEQAPR